MTTFKSSNDALSTFHVGADYSTHIVPAVSSLPWLQPAIVVRLSEGDSNATLCVVTVRATGFKTLRLITVLHVSPSVVVLVPGTFSVGGVKSMITVHVHADVTIQRWGPCVTSSLILKPAVVIRCSEYDRLAYFIFLAPCSTVLETSWKEVYGIGSPVVDIFPFATIIVYFRLPWLYSILPWLYLRLRNGAFIVTLRWFFLKSSTFFLSFLW